MSTTEWANRYRVLSQEESSRPGRYSDALTPWVRGIQDAMDDPSIWKVVCQKSAQIAWTTAVNSWLGKVIDTDPSPVIAMFAKEMAAKEYREEKLGPMVVATPRLRGKIDVETTRKAGNRWAFLRFPGGFLKLVGSNSPSNVKSTPAPRIIVEEPDDAADNVGKQGDAIKLLEERTKTYDERKVIFGGTPSVRGLSAIEAAYQVSDQRRFYVPCHECGDAHVLDWGNVAWDHADAPWHEIYGTALPETATYACPHCGCVWDDAQRFDNVCRGEWVAEAKSDGVAGFFISELYAPWKASRLEQLVRRYLAANHALESGDDTDMVVFVNSCLGLPYEFQGEHLNAEALREKASDYAERVVPAGGLILSAGVDVQHDRLAVVVRAWGRDEESWLVWWGEIHGTTTDKGDGVWRELDHVLLEPYRHANGATLRIQAASIDASDGGTSDAVYQYVRSRMARMPALMAIKGSSHDYGQREIFARPSASVDSVGQRNTKAAKYGLKPYIVGTTKAKDLLSARLSLRGHGPGRMHCYDGVRVDYWDQMTGEVKAPHRTMRGKRIWQRKAGAKVEAWDCEVYALHASRALKVHIYKARDWDFLERRLAQIDLLSEAPQAATETAASEPLVPAPRRRRGFVHRWKG